MEINQVDGQTVGYPSLNTLIWVTILQRLYEDMVGQRPTLPNYHHNNYRHSSWKTPIQRGRTT